MRARSQKFYNKTMEEILMRYNMISGINLYRKNNIWTLEFDYGKPVYDPEDNVSYPESYHVIYEIHKDGSYEFIDQYKL